jgi:hypothetical protein
LTPTDTHIQATLQSAKDITLKQAITVCPFDHTACKEEMEAIEQSAKEAAHVSQDNPMLPAPLIVRPNDPGGFEMLGMTWVGSQRKVLID